MSISMYQASVPVFLQLLGNLKKILEKGQAHATTKKYDTAVLVQARLAPDMLPLVRQIQIATDNAKGCAARLAGIEPPKFADDEATYAQLTERIDKTIAFLKSVKPEQVDGSEERPVVLKFPNNTFEFKGLGYLTSFALPNFTFHVVTAYNILRHNGVEIGKRDFLGG
ncbi:MAG TPA: DUF1993 domain-containing protein [Verrucomicrobiae bacterium]|nr:DUF1993 domain-containing protein [Verrucomicrobiae bacterium]